MLDFEIILQKWLLGDPLTKLTFLSRFEKKHDRQGAWHIFLYKHIVKLQTTSPPKAIVLFQPNFIGMIIGWSFLKIAKRNEIHEELWLPWQPIGKNFF